MVVSFDVVLFPVWLIMKHCLAFFKTLKRWQLCCRASTSKLPSNMSRSKNLPNILHFLPAHLFMPARKVAALGISVDQRNPSQKQLRESLACADCGRGFRKAFSKERHGSHCAGKKKRKRRDMLAKERVQPQQRQHQEVVVIDDNDEVVLLGDGEADVAVAVLEGGDDEVVLLQEDEVTVLD